MIKATQLPKINGNATELTYEIPENTTGRLLNTRYKIIPNATKINGVLSFSLKNFKTLTPL